MRFWKYRWVLYVKMLKRTRFFEITKDGETRILTNGGRGGLGNWHFKSSTQQTPRFAQPGERVKKTGISWN
jgi:GTPase involved in cell partitioning and DNA repair